MKPQLTNGQLALRLLPDFAFTGLGVWELLSDMRGSGWIAFDVAFLAMVCWLTITDLHNWKDRSPRFIPVKRPRP